MPTAATEVRTTVHAKVIRADGRIEDLGCVASSKRRLTLRERLSLRLKRK